jgi:ABC-type Fe3+-hydroxamate transport system substrate-binding protein
MADLSRLIKVQTAAQNNPTNDLVPIDPQAKSAIDNLSKHIAQVASTLSKVKTHVSVLRSGQTGGGTDRLSFPPISAEAFARAKHVVEQFTGSATASFLSMEQGIAVAGFYRRNCSLTL